MRIKNISELNNAAQDGKKPVFDEIQKEKIKNIFKTEFFLALISFALPFAMALVYVLVSTNSFNEVFASAYRYAILGGIMYFVMNSAVLFHAVQLKKSAFTSSVSFA